MEKQKFVTVRGYSGITALWRKLEAVAGLERRQIVEM